MVSIHCIKGGVVRSGGALRQWACGKWGNWGDRPVTLSVARRNRGAWRQERGVRQDRIRERADTVAFVREEGLIGEQNKVGSVYSRRIGLWVYLGHGYRGIIIKGVAGVGLQRQVGQSGNISVF